ncbi:hypothetical protein BG005_001544 [Podila minutissima]|nr:hypothetical protein BG005_001544 [Podila minutissima]
MAAYGIIAYPFLERIREEMSELELIFETYRDKGTIAAATLPRHLPSLRDRETHKQFPFEGLQKHYHILEEQEAAMVLASNDDQQIHRHLLRTKKVIDLIEKVLHKRRVSSYYPTLPKCLLSCYDKNSQVDGEAMLKRYRSGDIMYLQEFLIVMASKDEDAAEEHLRRIRMAVAAIERMMHKNRASKYYAPLLKCHDAMDPVL